MMTRWIRHLAANPSKVAESHSSKRDLCLNEFEHVGLAKRMPVSLLTEWTESTMDGVECRKLEWKTEHNSKTFTANCVYANNMTLLLLVLMRIKKGIMSDVEEGTMQALFLLEGQLIPSCKFNLLSFLVNLPCLLLHLSELVNCLQRLLHSSLLQHLSNASTWCIWFILHCQHSTKQWHWWIQVLPTKNLYCFLPMSIHLKDLQSGRNNCWIIWWATNESTKQLMRMRAISWEWKASWLIWQGCTENHIRSWTAIATERIYDSCQLSCRNNEWYRRA